MNLPFALDTTVWSNVRPIIVTPAADPTAAQTVAGAIRRAPVYVEQQPSRGVYVAARLNWLLPDANLAGYAPQPADVVTDATDPDGTAWTVLQAQRVGGGIGGGTTWRLETIDLTLAFGLYDLASVLRATNTQDAAGFRVPTFAPAANAVPARFQPLDGEQADERGKRITATRYSVYVGRQLDLLTDDRLQDGAGNVYEVTGWRNPQRLEELQVVDAKLVS